jgi:hypothetical protein
VVLNGFYSKLRLKRLADTSLWDLPKSNMRLVFLVVTQGQMRRSGGNLPQIDWNFMKMVIGATQEVGLEVQP